MTMSELGMRMSELAPANPSAGERVAGIVDLLQEILLRLPDLLPEIILRLPAKSLIRFKLVSKQWQSLISDPKFAQSHVVINPSIPPPSGMFVDFFNSGKIDFFRLGGGTNQANPTFDFIINVYRELEGRFPGNGYEVLQSCNGLFLFSSSGYYDLCVCNLTTKQYRFLPKLELPSGERWRVSAVGFAFDPSISPHYYVVSERFIESICTLTPSLCTHPGVSHNWTFRVDVYSSKDHKWRLLDFKEREPNAPYIQSGQDGIFYDGGIHCLGQHSFHFDLKSECLVQREWPDPRDARAYVDAPPSWPRTTRAIVPSPVGLRDKYLYMSAYQEKKLYVFETSKDYREWVVKYSLNFCQLTSAYPEILPTKRFNVRKFAAFALGVVEGLTEEDADLLLAIPGKIISYNFMREEVKTVYNFPAELKETFDVSTFPFIETLSPV